MSRGFAQETYFLKVCCHKVRVELADEGAGRGCHIVVHLPEQPDRLVEVLDAGHRALDRRHAVQVETEGACEGWAVARQRGKVGGGDRAWWALLR
jgi:hypothetical protein